MKIPSNSTATPVSAAAPSTASEKTAQAPATESASDTFSQMQTQSLRDALGAEPATRADKIAHARQLLADPNYPSSDVLKEVASVFVKDATRAPKAE